MVFIQVFLAIILALWLFKSPKTFLGAFLIIVGLLIMTIAETKDTFVFGTLTILGGIYALWYNISKDNRKNIKIKLFMLLYFCLFIMFLLLSLSFIFTVVIDLFKMLFGDTTFIGWIKTISLTFTVILLLFLSFLGYREEAKKLSIDNENFLFSIQQYIGDENLEYIKTKIILFLFYFLITIFVLTSLFGIFYVVIDLFKMLFGDTTFIRWIIEISLTLLSLFFLAFSFTGYKELVKKRSDDNRHLVKLKKIKFTSSAKVLTLRDFEYHRIEF